MKSYISLDVEPWCRNLFFRRAEIEARIAGVTLGTNTQAGHILLLQDFLTFCQQNHLRIKLEKCEFMREVMEYLGFEVGMVGGKQLHRRCNPYRT